MTEKTRITKPKKPYPDFPLFPHASGRWAKKIKGKLVYFGKWDDSDAALTKYLAERDDLQAGRKPRGKSDGVTVREVVNRFLTAKRHLIDTRELSPRTFQGYHSTCLRVAEAFGPTRPISDLRPDDFDALRASFAKTRGPVALGNEVRHVRILFKYAHDAGLIETPVRLGPTFKEPSKRIMRQTRQAAGPRMFEAEELRAIVAAASEPLRSMILLGINAGFGQTDCSSLPRSAVNLETGWIEFPRPKTAVPRRVPLWPETHSSLTVAFAARPAAKESADERLAFLTRFGRPWVRMRETEGGDRTRTVYTPIDSVALLFGRLLTGLGLKRPGLNFYAIRHTFETVAGESRDQVAVDAVTGHDAGDMASRYRERISDDRLRAVADHVRRWLFGEAQPA